MHRVLMLHDGCQLNEPLVRSLQAVGVEVIEAFNVLGAVQLMSEASVDAVFIDFTRPALGQFLLVQQLHDAPARLPVVAIIGPDRPAWLPRLLQLGVHHVFDRAKQVYDELHVAAHDTPQHHPRAAA